MKGGTEMVLLIGRSLWGGTEGTSPRCAPRLATDPLRAIPAYPLQQDHF